MKRKLTCRVLSLLLVLCMLFSAIPVTASAATSSSSCTLTLTLPDGVDPSDVTVKLYSKTPTISSGNSTSTILSTMGTAVTASSSSNGTYTYSVTAGSTYAYYVGGDGYYSIIKLVYIASGTTSKSVEVMAYETSTNTDGYQATVVPTGLISGNTIPSTYTQDYRDVCIVVWTDEINASIFQNDYTYNTPAFDGTDAYYEFTTQEEMMDFLEAEAAASDLVYLYSCGTSPNYNYDIPLVILSSADLSSATTLEEAAAIINDDGKPIVWYQAQIHANEPASGEGALAVIDDFVNDAETQALLENVNIVVIPRVNTEGSYLFTRYNYDGTDLNRDNMLLSDESMVQIRAAYLLFMPEVVLDGHEFTYYAVSSSSMSKAEDLESLCATSLNVESGLVSMGLDMVGEMFDDAEDAGLRVYYYTLTADSTVGREFYGLYGSIAILVETRGIGAGKENFARRVYSQETAMLSYISYVAENADDVLETVATARANIVSMGTTYSESNIIALRQTTSNGGTSSGLTCTKYTCSMAGTLSVSSTTTLALYNSTTVSGTDYSRSRPTAYVLAADSENIEDMLAVLDKQGIYYYELAEGETVTLQQYYLKSTTGSNSCIAGLRSAASVTFENGAYVIPMDQVAGTVIALLMEPDFYSSNGKNGTFYQDGFLIADSSTSNFTLYRCTEDNPREYLVAATSEEEETDACTNGHSYVSAVTAPTCTEAGYTTYTCSVCGDSYTADETAAIGHSYVSVVTAPTCTEAGYTTYTCSACGDSYIADQTEATGHSYEAGICTICGEADPDYSEPETPVEGTVAQVASTGVIYNSLQEAINAAADGDTVTLLCDVTETIVVEASANITIDLGGYTVTGSDDSVFTINGTVTIQNGTITGGYGTRGGGIRVYGTVTLEAGLLITGNTVYDSTSTCYGGGIYVYDGGTLIMNDGVVITGNSAVAGDGYKAFAGGVYAAKGATFYMNGGYIYGNSASTYGNDVGLGSTAIWTLSMDFGTCVDAEGHLYTGWYKDSSSAIWSESNITTGSEFTTTTSGSNGYGTVVYLTAGHGEDPTYPEEDTYTFQIITQPTSVEANLNETVSFTVEAEGEGLTYQWYHKTATCTCGEWHICYDVGVNSGSNTDTYTTVATALRNGYTYMCEVTDAYGTVLATEVVTLTLASSTLEIVTDPKDVEATAGDNATFTVAATGEGLTYQWQFKTATGSKWYSCTNGEGESLVIAATTARDGYSYRCVVTDQYGNTATSAAATLTVTVQDPIVIEAIAAKNVVAAGDTAEFSVTATGEGLTYQWQFKTATGTKWYTCTGESVTSSTLEIAATAARNGYSYRCKITDANGNVTYTDAMTLTVN